MSVLSFDSSYSAVRYYLPVQILAGSCGCCLLGSYTMMYGTGPAWGGGTVRYRTPGGTYVQDTEKNGTVPVKNPSDGLSHELTG